MDRRKGGYYLKGNPNRAKFGPSANIPGSMLNKSRSRRGRNNIVLENERKLLEEYHRKKKRDTEKHETKHEDGPSGVIEPDLVYFKHGECGRKCHKKCPTGPTGPTGPSGSCEITFKTDDGDATPNDDCEIEIIGSDVMSTSGEDNKVTIRDNAYITEYVVDPNTDNDATYRTLDAALKAASVDPSEFPINVYLRPGDYVLEADSVSNEKAINIIGASMGGRPCAFISGSSRSYGLKFWQSVQFNNLDGNDNPLDTYTLNNPTPKPGFVDRFQNCYFVNNYKVTISNENVRFNECRFSNLELNRTNGIIELQPGSGFIVCRDTFFEFFRKSSSPSQSLIYMAAGTDITESTIQGCKFEGIVEASSANTIIFSLITIADNQLVKFIDCNVRINPNRQTSTPINMFGPANADPNANPPTPGYSIDVNLFVANSIFGGPSENANEKVFLISNLWTNQDSIDAITIRGCELDGVRMINHDISRSTNDNTVQNVVIQSCAVIERSSQLFSILIGGNIRYNLYISNCFLQSEDNKPVFEWIQDGDDSERNKIFLSLTSVLFFNSYISNPAFPVWLTTNVKCEPYNVHDPTDPNQPYIMTDGFAIFRSDARIYNYKSGVNTGVSTKPELFEYADVSIV